MAESQMKLISDIKITYIYFQSLDDFNALNAFVL